MKQGIAILMLVLFIACLIVPAYADEMQAKRAENHKKIADFIVDTVKLPMVLMGILAGEKTDKIEKDLQHKGNTGITDALRKSEEKK